MTNSETAVHTSLLHQMLRVDEDGSLTWLCRPASHFNASAGRSAQHVAANWNAHYAGKPALTCVTPFGHKTGRINRLPFYAHRVVWAMNTGRWPEHEIDHINGCAGDNHMANLRDVPHMLNLRNQAARKTNTSGFNGVYRFKRDSNWVAAIVVNGRSVHLGYFATAEEANQARIAANAKHQFHANHGRSAA